MGRSRWPPNSFTEWVVGQNFKNTPQRSSSQTPILTVSISEDEASGSEKVEITYPGRRRINRPTTQPPSEALPSRRVRFDRNSRPLKSALKKRADIDTSSDTLVEDSSEDPTTEEESSAVEDSESSEDEAYSRRKRLLADKKLRAAIFCRKKNNDSEDSSGVEDDLPHPTCRCMDCVKGRRVLKSMSKLDLKPEVSEAESSDGSTNKQKGKPKDQKKGKGKGKKGEASSADATSTEANETTQTEDSGDTEEDKKKVSPKQKNKKSNPKTNRKASPRETEPPKPVDKNAFKLTKYPKSMEPNLIMPVRSKVLQCEHTIEGPRDPRPNAFIDSGKGIVRVYHGPTWGNHTGELYGNVNPAKMPSPLPSSAGPYPGFNGYPPGPHGYPPGAPGYYGPPPYGPYPPYPPHPPAGPSPRFPASPPPGSPFAKNMPPAPPNGTTVKNVQMPDNTATKEPASKAMGISGNAWPGTPALLREVPGQGQQEKAKSDAADNVGPSQGAGSQKESQNGGNVRWDSSSNQGWGGSGNQAWGEKTLNSPADFSGWGGNKGGFERTSNKSEKSAIDGNWFGKPDKKSPVSINDSPIHEGGNNGWGDSGNKGWGASENIGWGESGNKDWKDSGDKGWTDSVGNGWKSSPVAAASPESNKPPSAQPWGLQENGGGGKGWGDKGTDEGDNQGWATQDAGEDTWKATDNSGNDNQKWGSGFNDDQGWSGDKTDDGGGWYQNDANKSGGWDNDKADTGGGWSNDKANGAWNDVGSGPNRNSPQGGRGGNVWGGPPHSRPSSQRPSDEHGWGNSCRNSGNDNGNENGNDNNVVPGPMPGAWVDNYGNQHSGGGSNRPSPREWKHNQNRYNRYNNDNNNNNNGGGSGNTHRASPKETYVGAFDWPGGQGPPSGSANHRWNGNGGYNGPRSSPANNWKGGNGGYSGSPPQGPPAGGWNGRTGSNGTRDKPPTPPDPSTAYQFGSGGYGGTKQQKYGENSGRHVTGWKPPGEYAGIGVDDNLSNNAGPTNHSWANLSLAQDTGGKADNW